MTQIPQAIVRLAVAIAIPTMACFGYYSLDGRTDSAWSVWIILAYPLAIIGLVGIAAVLSSSKRSLPLLWLASACVAVPVAFLMIVRW